ncbi:MAG: biopolymer transporter ExbD [Myxococcota bacterium]
MAREKRRGGRQGDSKIPEPDLLPIMNIILVLILAMLTMAAFVPLGVITTKAPKLSGGGRASSQQQPQDDKPKLSLTIFMVQEGYNLSMFGKTYKAPKDNPEAKAFIPKRDENGEQVYDFEALRKKLVEVKEKNPEEEQVTVLAHDDALYSSVISTMDAIRLTDDKKPMFPMVAFGAGIF